MSEAGRQRRSLASCAAPLVESRYRTSVRRITTLRQSSPAVRTRALSRSDSAAVGGAGSTTLIRVSSTDTPGHDAAEPGSRNDGAPARRVEKKGQPWYIEIPLLVVIALVLVLVFQTFVGRVYQIPSESMEPTLHGCPGCTGDRIMVDKMTYRFTAPEPGDVRA